MDGGRDLLKDYRAKRDFSRTPEPEHGSTGPGNSFVVQKHDATRLHYDFRLELDGVLKSWAVTKGPSYDPREKRLAVRTEDHPLAYGGFEGVIPKGNYGAGEVMLWDRGAWVPDGDPREGLKAGKLTFALEGERLRGKWSLVRMRPRGKETRENWLLVKNDDETADPSHDVLAAHTVSVETGRTLEQIAETGRALGAADLKDEAPDEGSARPRSTGSRAARPKATKGKAAKSTGLPPWREPQLAVLESAPPDGDGWLVEMKYDGYRVLIAKDGGDVRLYTRNGHDWTGRWPNLAEAVRNLDVRSCLLDGEVVAFDADGKPDFSTLQQTMTDMGPVSCFVFDCLALDGEDLSPRPLTERKERLAHIVGKRSKPLLYSDHVEGHADAVLDRLCREGHEGIVMKRADRPYRGGRSRDWLKVKCTRRQEFVIGGWQPSDKRGRAFSSILLGAHRDGKLIYAGKVGTGFDARRMEELATLFDGLSRKTSPFASLPREVRGARFVSPELVAEVEFAEMTADGAIRHGAFKGLREDKPASEIVFEAPTEAAMTQAADPIPHETRDRIAGVKLSSPDKVLFKSQGVTKADLAAHYERVADRMLPHAGNRLLSLVRCPEGRAAACFFQKHPHKTLPDRFRTLEVEESNGKKEPYVWIDGAPGLVAGVQMGVLEWHIWGSRIDRIERPDRLVFDLDPDEGLAFADVRDAAVDIRDRLADLGLRSVPMITGGKGVHVIAPLARRLDWPEVKAFAQNFARTVARDDPARYVAVMTKAKRKGRIFLDYLRNQRGATAIAPFSTRAREGCPVAVPVAWDELKTLDRANGVSLAEAAERAEAPDPWADAPASQSITKKARDAVEA